MRDIGQGSQSHSAVDFMLSGDGATAKWVLESFAKLKIIKDVQPCSTSTPTHNCYSSFLVSTPLKKISQIGSFRRVGVKIIFETTTYFENPLHKSTILQMFNVQAARPGLLQHL